MLSEDAEQVSSVIIVNVTVARNQCGCVYCSKFIIPWCHAYFKVLGVFCLILLQYHIRLNNAITKWYFAHAKTNNFCTYHRGACLVCHTVVHHIEFVSRLLLLLRDVERGTKWWMDLHDFENKLFIVKRSKNLLPYIWSKSSLRVS